MPRRAVPLTRTRLQCVKQLPVGRDAKLVVNPQRRRETVSGFLIPRQHLVDSAGAWALSPSIFFQNDVALTFELPKLRDSSDGRVDLSKDKRCLLGAACGTVDSATGLSLRTDQVSSKPVRRSDPVFPFPRTTDETARRTLPL